MMKRTGLFPHLSLVFVRQGALSEGLPPVGEPEHCCVVMRKMISNATGVTFPICWLRVLG